MQKLFLFFILFSVSLFAAESSIYTWGYGELFYRVLQAVTILSQDNYIFKSAVAIGGFLLMIKNTVSGASSSDMAVTMGKYLFTITLIIGLFSTSTKRYIIEDEVTNQTFIVNNVPIGIGETFSLFTNLERNLARGFQSAMATPNSLNYTDVGLGFTMAAPLNVKSLIAADGHTRRTFNEYMGNCIFSAIAMNEISADIINFSTILKADLKVTGYLTPYYSTANPNGIDKQCEDVWELLVNTDIRQQLDVLEPLLAQEMGITQDKYQGAMAATSQLLFSTSKNSKDYLMQQTLINMTKDGIKATALAAGGDVQALAYASAAAEANQQQTLMTMGKMAQKNLPLYKAILTVLVLGIFILLVLLSVIYGDLGHIKMGFTLLFAMILWTPLAIILNAMTFITIESQLIWPQVDGGLTFFRTHKMHEDLALLIALIGYVGTMIPVLAYSIAKKSEQGFVSFFSGAGAVANSSASSAAAQTASGNISVGNSSLGKFSATDMHGTHDYLGQDSWRASHVANDGSLRTKTTNAQGIGTQTSDSAGLGQITADAHGTKITSVKDTTISAGLVNDISASTGKTLQELASNSAAFNSSFAHSLANGSTAGGTNIDTNTFSDTNTWGHATGEALTKVTQEGITNTLKQMTSNGHKFNFSSDHNANAGANANLTIGSPDGVSLFTGMSVKGNATIGYTVTGKSSDSKDFSTTITGDDAKTFGDTFSKNLTSSINENESLSLGLAKQAQKTGGFNDSDILTKADNYVKSWSDSESITKLHNITSRQGLSMTHDLLPDALNNYINNSPELSKIDLLDAGKIAIEQMRGGMHIDETRKAFEAASGTNLNLDMSGVQKAKDVIGEAEDKFKQQREHYKAQSTNVEERVEAIVPDIIKNTSNVPKNNSDMANINDSITKRYQQAHEEKRAEASGDMQDFTKQNKVNTKDEIDGGKDKIQENFYHAKDELGIWGTLKQNPMIDSTAKAIGLEGEFDKMINTIENKDYARIETAHDKALQDGLIGTKNPASSAANTRINTEKVENFSTQELKDMLTWEKMHPERDEINNAAERQLEQAVQNRENKVMQDKVQKAEKSVKTITEAVAEMKQNEQ
ncbi:hypothetical protein Suden_0805 [Sulfurimonas denitrificans DSM 1251]|uniref:TraG N-terminal Proteobacteria domain-containing protein n=1 Tax=Sulfurimonas denitrificans (strain ATCC 33889 / DSM 1251) TaxID=326298 RepID=Q30SE7_SULDN|nr:conjugal transfer protein TraG N-terminal domain-containing protein [Sulfurimonas denitrificans]ABB44084.1 hypothetical protein Suden_0805 [Sulfurimonas denitrificans DSM 1251]